MTVHRKIKFYHFKLIYYDVLSIQVVLVMWYYSKVLRAITFCSGCETNEGLQVDGVALFMCSRKAIRSKIMDVSTETSLG